MWVTKRKICKISAEELIIKSRITNDIHMNMRILLAQVEELAMEGIDENLDPNCISIFNRARKDANELAAMIKAELAAMIKAELAAHISKNKWG